MSHLLPLLHIPGNTVKVTINQYQNVLLDRCEDETDFDECIDEKLHEILVKEVNCSVPWLSNKKNICKVWYDCDHSFSLHNFCLFQTQFTQSKSFHLFQENRKNQKGICKESCHQNNIGYGPINFDKIKEATIQGRAVFHLPKTLRVNREMFLHTTSELLPDTIGVISLIIIIGVFIYKIIVAKTNKKTESKIPLPVKSASSSSASSFVLGISFKRNWQCLMCKMLV